MKIFGLAGTNGSGKDTIAQLLEEEHDYLYVSATEMLGAELTKRGLPHERVNKANLSAEWRRKYGMSAIVDRAVEQFNEHPGKYKGLIVGSLRHPGEADKIHALGGKLIWVDADPKIRYKRIQSNNRGRLEDNKTYEEFLAEEAREMMPVGDIATLNASAVKDKADIFIENNGMNVDDFKDQVRQELGAYL